MSAPEPSHPFQVAHELLESALRLYFEGNANFAALHLAAAAEELLGKLLREKDGTPYLNFLQRIMMEAWNKLAKEGFQTIDGEPISARSIAAFMNSAKNHVKHSIVPGTYDAHAEARDMLWRALSNYSGLLDKGATRPAASELMERLYDECFELIVNTKEP